MDLDCRKGQPSPDAIQAKTGDFVYVPRNTRRGRSQEPPRMLVWVAPAGAETFFKEMDREVKEIPRDFPKGAGACRASRNHGGNFIGREILSSVGVLPSRCRSFLSGFHVKIECLCYFCTLIHWLGIRLNFGTEIAVKHNCRDGCPRVFYTF
jgi:hypothetical protein